MKKKKKLLPICNLKIYEILSSPINVQILWGDYSSIMVVLKSLVNNFESTLKEIKWGLLGESFVKKSGNITLRCLPKGITKPTAEVVFKQISRRKSN